MTDLKDKIAKLPRWAQDYIWKIEAERNSAVRELIEFRDSQTPSKFSYDATPCIGEDHRPEIDDLTGTGRGPSFIERFVQTYKMEINHAGVKLRVSTHPDNCILLSYEDQGRMGRQVSLVPTGYQTLELMAKENMR